MNLATISDQISIVTGRTANDIIVAVTARGTSARGLLHLLSRQQQLQSSPAFP